MQPLDRICGAHAVAFLVGKTPEAVWNDVGKSNWTEGFGSNMGGIHRMLAHYSYDEKIRPDLIYNDNGNNRQYGSLLAQIGATPALRTASFLIYTANHVSATRNGKVSDVADTGDRAKVESVYEVTKAQAK